MKCPACNEPMKVASVYKNPPDGIVIRYECPGDGKQAHNVFTQGEDIVGAIRDAVDAGWIGLSEPAKESAPQIGTLAWELDRLGGRFVQYLIGVDSNIGAIWRAKDLLHELRSSKTMPQGSQPRAPDECRALGPHLNHPIVRIDGQYYIAEEGHSLRKLQLRYVGTPEDAGNLYGAVRGSARRNQFSVDDVKSGA